MYWYHVSSPCTCATFLYLLRRHWCAYGCKTSCTNNCYVHDVRCIHIHSYVLLRTCRPSFLCDRVLEQRHIYDLSCAVFSNDTAIGTGRSPLACRVGHGRYPALHRGSLAGTNAGLRARVSKFAHATACHPYVDGIYLSGVFPVSIQSDFHRWQCQGHSRCI